MPSRTPVELDFLGLRPAAAAAADDDERRHGSTGTAAASSIRGMKTSAIASIGARQLRRVIAGDDEAPAPAMTLFYNGAVATFDGVSQDKAEAIMKMAMEVATSNGGRVVRGDAFAGNFAKDMPLTRTKSLQQFLQKRKESERSLNDKEEWDSITSNGTRAYQAERVGSVSGGTGRDRPRCCGGDQAVSSCEGGSSLISCLAAWRLESIRYLSLS